MEEEGQNLNLVTDIVMFTTKTKEGRSGGSKLKCG